MFPGNQNDALFEATVHDLMQQMASVQADSPEYTAMAKNFQTLMEAKSKDKARRVSSDAVLAAAANLAGILLILKHEQLNIITSKAMAFVPKFR